MLEAAISVSSLQARHVRACFECPGTLPSHQVNKNKVDNRELIVIIDMFTTNADVCAQKLRELWHEGSNDATYKPEGGLFTNTHTQITVAFSDNNVEGMEVLPHATWICLNVALMIM